MDRRREMAAEAEIAMRKELQRAMRQSVSRLTDMAQAIEHIAQELDQPVVGLYASYVARVQHEVFWGVANLSLDRLTREAGNLDMTHQMAQPVDEGA